MKSDGIKARPQSYAQSAERGVGDATAQKDHTSCHDVGADDATHDAREDCGQEGVHQVLILEYVGKKLHCTLKTRTNLL